MQRISHVPILILAAGSSSRMRGVDKLTLDVHGEPLLTRTVRLAREATKGPVLVTLPPQPHPRYELVRDSDVRIVEVPDPSEGMNASIRAGIAALPRKNTFSVMILVADLPDLRLEDIQTMARFSRLEKGTLICRPMSDSGKPGHPVVFDRSLFDELADLTGDDGARQIVERYKDQICFVFPGGDSMHTDLDTPEDWANWRQVRAAKE